MTGKNNIRWCVPGNGDFRCHHGKVDSVLLCTRTVALGWTCWAVYGLGFLLPYNKWCVVFYFIVAFLQLNMFDVLFHSGFPSAERPVQPLLGMGPRGWRVLCAHEESPAAGSVTIFGSSIQIWFEYSSGLCSHSQISTCLGLVLF